MIEKELVIDMRDLIRDLQEKVNNDQCVVLKGQGVSMVPFITCDDTLTLTKPKSKRAKIGEIYLYQRFDGSYAIHRVYRVQKEWVFMLGDGQLFIEKVPPSALVALVTGVEKPHKTIDCTRLFVRLSCVIRMKRRVAKANRSRPLRTLFWSTWALLGKIKKRLGKKSKYGERY